jgi:hypothetical protein
LIRSARQASSVWTICWVMNMVEPAFSRLLTSNVRVYAATDLIQFADFEDTRRAA